ncbi:MAG: 16S rRNA (cytosine(1402)-N(4))-methyltransferase [Gammaproteobacteria bacterium RBG_16_57_12]|nr:MAG: 16S rRNA (cytosine(1402)-N(4))-methyltransferase [Gammaproteobacteria bacterium RBG_16_57_12]
MAEIVAHLPVLLEEALEGLKIKENGIYIDGTFGRGGHSGAILAQLGEEGQLLGIDKDPEAVRAAQTRFGGDNRFAIVQGTFAAIKNHAVNRWWLGKVDGILLDLGVSSPQLDDSNRGFSFRLEGPLDMRMDFTSGMSAAHWLAQAAEREIAEVLREYGEERFARRIARAIVAARQESPIVTTLRLAEIVRQANPAWERDKDPATRSFQAIRIFINSELEDLEIALAQALEVLGPGGRLAVISFHSLEDRIVKRFMRAQSRGDEFPPDLPVRHAQLNPRLQLVGKAIRPGEAELARNPRARSAVLRIAEKLS